MHHCMCHVSREVDRDKAFSEILFFFLHHIKGGSLIAEMCTNLFFRGSRHEESQTGKCRSFEAAIIVPLRTKLQDSIAVVIRAAKDVPVHIRSGKVHAMRRMNFASASPFARAD